MMATADSNSFTAGGSIQAVLIMTSDSLDSFRITEQKVKTLFVSIAQAILFLGSSMPKITVNIVLRYAALCDLNYIDLNFFEVPFHWKPFT